MAAGSGPPGHEPDLDTAEGAREVDRLTSRDVGAPGHHRRSASSRLRSCLDGATLAAAAVLAACCAAWYTARFPAQPPRWLAAAGRAPLASCDAASAAAREWDERQFVADPAYRWWGGLHGDAGVRNSVLPPAWDSRCVKPYGPTDRDGYKLLYDLAYLRAAAAEAAPCVVYSVGGNKQVEFEEAVLAATPCHVWQFDCTVSVAEMEPVVAAMEHGSRMHFLPYCVGAEGATLRLPAHGGMLNHDDSGFQEHRLRSLSSIMAELGHDALALLKFDAEGSEHAALPAFVEQHAAAARALPAQLSVEVHSYTGPTSASAALPLFRSLYQAGYVEVARELNALSPGCCMEFTFVRGCAWGSAPGCEGSA